MNNNYIYDIKKYSLNDELKFIIKEYFLSLLGIVLNENEFKNYTVRNKKIINSTVFLEKNHIVFLGSKKSKEGFKIPIASTFKENHLAKIRMIYDEIIKVTYNDFEVSGHILNKYDNFSRLLAAYEYAVQRGVANWISDGNSEHFMRLLSVLEKWSTKTYEGKSMPFGFVINFRYSSGKFNYIDFLEEEYAATFSDCITSIIELDNEMRFIQYHSTTENNVYRQTDLSNTPYRFSQVIENFTKGKVGVFLLTNGDIIIIRNARIELIKRNGKWINFNKDVFVSTVMSVNKKYPGLVTPELLQSLYYTALDVSFSHSGGLLAVVHDKNKLLKPTNNRSKVPLNNGNSIINELDNFQTIIPPYNELFMSDRKKYGDYNMRKKIIKREAILQLLDKYKNENKDQNIIKFSDIDRKLRAELVSMDGATIIDSDENIISFGAIIKNDSGSYGGGRGAAARKLSKYGLSIKISTDGYIEVYIDGNMKYKMK